MKLNLILALLLSIALWTANFYSQRAEMAEENLRLSQQQRHILITHIRRMYNEKIILEQNYAILEAAAKEDTAVFDWYADISTSRVIRSLQSH